MKKLRVTIEGKTYDVLVEMIDESASAGLLASSSAPAAAVAAANPVAPVAAAAPISAGTARGSTAHVTTPDDVVSPLAGKVVSIDVKVGQVVNEGTQVATLEAMKMNTYIYAPKRGKIAAVLVNSGDAVEEGSVLLKLG